MTGVGGRGLDVGEETNVDFLTRPRVPRIATSRSRYQNGPPGAMSSDFGSLDSITSRPLTLVPLSSLRYGRTLVGVREWAVRLDPPADRQRSVFPVDRV